MALPLSHENLPAAYEYLRACEPFRRWKLPEADEVGFAVIRKRDRFGHMIGTVRSTEAVIGISEVCVGSTQKLIETMAHEILHLYQHLRNTETPGVQHNAEFRRLARLICKTHIFDFKAFV